MHFFVCLFVVVFLSYHYIFLGLDCCDCCDSGLELAVCPQHALLFEVSGIRYYFFLVSCWSWWWQGKIHSQMRLHMAVGVCVWGMGWVGQSFSLNPVKLTELSTKPFSIHGYIASSLNEWTREDGLWKTFWWPWHWNETHSVCRVWQEHSGLLYMFALTFGSLLMEFEMSSLEVY